MKLLCEAGVTRAGWDLLRFTWRDLAGRAAGKVVGEIVATPALAAA